MDIVGVHQRVQDKEYKTIAVSETVGCNGCPFEDGKGGCESPIEIDDATDNDCGGIIWVEVI